MQKVLPKNTYVREWKEKSVRLASLRPGRGIVGTHHGEILGFSKEAENILWQVFQPGKDLAVGEGEGLLLLQGVHIDVVALDHHAAGMGVHAGMHFTGPRTYMRTVCMWIRCGGHGVSVLWSLCRRDSMVIPRLGCCGCPRV